MVDEFVCNTCLKSFSRNFNYKRHLKSMVCQKNKDYSCPKCLKKFQRLAFLEYHLENSVCDKIVLLSFPYKLLNTKFQLDLSCHNCLRTFTRNSSLKYHISRNVCSDIKILEFDTIEEFNSYRSTKFENFRQIKGSKTLKDGHCITLYCIGYFNRPTLARLRAPSLNKFLKSHLQRCKGKLNIHYLSDGSIRCSVFKCTNITHLARKKLDVNEKKFIIEKLNCGMTFNNIRTSFVTKYSKNISRYDVNNIKYRNKISLAFFTNKNDLLSTKNLLNSLAKSHNIHSNIDVIDSLEKLICIIQFKHQKSIIELNTGVLCIDSTHGLSK